MTLKSDIKHKRPMGHIAHLRKQFKSLYHNVDSENKEKTLWEFIGSSFEQTWIPFTQGCFVPRLVEIGPVVLEKKILKFRKCVFSLFRNYLPLEKGWALHLNKLESPSPKDALCQVWLKLAQWFWRRRWKCEKFTDRRTDRQTDRQTDRRRTTGDQKSLLELSAQVS